MWGNPPQSAEKNTDDRPIPTCVGQPSLAIATISLCAAYPHVCGATSPISRETRSNWGLSPRVWGNRPRIVGGMPSTRPIPTCVGQPIFFSLHLLENKAYPHVCGATTRPRLLFGRVIGLSPRVWGNPSALAPDAQPARPIPTCVGQPLVVAAARRFPTAYPHVCGATFQQSHLWHLLEGLSPRVWGNHSISGELET